MKINIFAAFIICLLAFTTLYAQQVALPKSAADVTGAASGVLMHPDYAKAVGRMAYI